MGGGGGLTPEEMGSLEWSFSFCCELSPYGSEKPPIFWREGVMWTIRKNITNYGFFLDHLPRMRINGAHGRYRYQPSKFMKKYQKLFALGILGLTAAAAQATTYPGNGATGFGGPIGDAADGASLTFTTDGTTLFGTINTPTTATSLSDELVIYFDTTPGGFTDTSTLTDTGGATSNANGDVLRRATSGFGFNTSGAVTRSTVDFAPGFGANYAIALSPNNAFFGSFYTLNSASNFTYGSDGTNGNTNLSPTNASGPYTFSIPLSLLGSPTSFTFATTYLNSHSDIFRSNEAYNTVTDVTTPGNTGNLGTDTALLGFNTFVVASVPEPSSLALIGAGVASFLAFRRRVKRA